MSFFTLNCTRWFQGLQCLLWCNHQAVLCRHLFAQRGMAKVRWFCSVDWCTWSGWGKIQCAWSQSLCGAKGWIWMDLITSDYLCTSMYCIQIFLQDVPRLSKTSSDWCSLNMPEPFLSIMSNPCFSKSPSWFLQRCDKNSSRLPDAAVSETRPLRESDWYWINTQDLWLCKDVKTDRCIFLLFESFWIFLTCQWIPSPLCHETDSFFVGGGGHCLCNITWMKLIPACFVWSEVARKPRWLRGKEETSVFVTSIPVGYIVLDTRVPNAGWPAIGKGWVTLCQGVFVDVGWRMLKSLLDPHARHVWGWWRIQKAVKSTSLVKLWSPRAGCHTEKFHSFLPGLKWSETRLKAAPLLSMIL